MAPGICNPSSSNDSRAIKSVAGMYDWYQDGAGQDPASVRGKPVVLVMSALVHFFLPEQYRAMMAFWRNNLRRDSALVMTHGSLDDYSRGILNNVLAHYERMGMKAYLRSREELVDVMEGWTLMEPGIVRAGHWNPKAGEGEEDMPSNFEFWWVAVGSLM
jgi:hypothetical protein